MARHKNVDWSMSEGVSWDVAKLATLMDIRDELRTLNRVFACQNFLDVPQLLRDIKKNTTRPKAKARKRSK